LKLEAQPTEPEHETFGTKIYIPPYEKIINPLNTKASSIFLSK
jgi:hypothetical protein